MWKSRIVPADRLAVRAERSKRYLRDAQERCVQYSERGAIKGQGSAGQGRSLGSVGALNSP